MEKAEQCLDTVMKARTQKQQDFKHREDQLGDDEQIPDTEYDEHLDWMLKNEGEIRGMLKQLAIWRSTNSKTELERARLRLNYAK